MNRLRTLKSIFAALLLTLACASAARAQSVRTWVSGVGNDADPCNRNAPCRTFGGAFAKTAVNGEINVLDGGNYGTLNATKSVTVDGNGANSTVLSNSMNAIVVNIPAGDPDDPHRSVRLRNLSISGAGVNANGAGTRVGVYGVRFLSGTSLFVENVVINDFLRDGVAVHAAVAEANAVYVSLDNVQVRNCNNNGFTAIHNHPDGQVVVKLNNVRVHGCNVGVRGAGRTRINLRDSVVTHCTTGLQLLTSDNVMNVDDAFVSYATTALEADLDSTMRVSDTVVTQNATGLSPNGGTITSLSGNTVSGNSTNGAFNGAAVPKT